jgi:hypothetical protein
LASGERRAARHGVPRADAGPAPRGAHRAACGPAEAVQPPGATVSASRRGAGPESAANDLARARAAGVPAGAPHRGRACVQRAHRDASLPGLLAAGGRAPEVPGVRRREAGGVLRVELGTAAPGSARPVHRLVHGGAPAERAVRGLQHTVSDPAVGRGAAPRVAPSGADGADALGGMAARLWAPCVLRGDLRGAGALPGHVLSSRELDPAGAHDGPRQGRSDTSGKPLAQGRAGLSAHAGLSEASISSDLGGGP